MLASALLLSSPCPSTHPPATSRYGGHLFADAGGKLISTARCRQVLQALGACWHPAPRRAHGDDRRAVLHSSRAWRACQSTPAPAIHPGWKHSKAAMDHVLGADPEVTSAGGSVRSHILSRSHAPRTPASATHRLLLEPVAHAGMQQQLDRVAGVWLLPNVALVLARVAALAQ